MSSSTKLLARSTNQGHIPSIDEIAERRDTLRRPLRCMKGGLPFVVVVTDTKLGRILVLSSSYLEDVFDSYTMEP